MSDRLTVQLSPASCATCAALVASTATPALSQAERFFTTSAVVMCPFLYHEA